MDISQDMSNGQNPAPLNLQWPSNLQASTAVLTLLHPAYLLLHNNLRAWSTDIR